MNIKYQKSDAEGKENSKIRADHGKLKASPRKSIDALHSIHRILWGKEISDEDIVDVINELNSKKIVFKKSAKNGSG